MPSPYQPLVSSGTLSADVAATSGTFTVSYPNRVGPELGVHDSGDFYGAMRHKLVVGQSVYSYPGDFDITLGTSLITVTNKTAGSWAQGSTFRLEMEKQGKAVFQDNPASAATPGAKMARMARADVMLISMGAPDALVTNGIAAAQNRTNAGALLLNGSLVSGGVVTLDVPRNVIAKSGGADTAVVTVSGKDEYGQTMSEALTLNGTTAVSGKKAFKTVTGWSCGASIANTAFLGNGNVLGLPVFLPSTVNILAELSDGTAATAGTKVAGDKTAGGATTTTGDVRGTYVPNATPDGAKNVQLLVSVPDATHRGVTQA